MRWVFRAIGVVVVLVGLAVGALFVIPTDRIANLAAQQFKAMTGRDLVISGGVRPSLWPVIGARVGGVTMANMAGSGSGPMVQADSVDIGIDLAALASGSVVVRKFEADAPRIVLERDANGQANWQFSNLTGTAAPAAGGNTGTNATTPATSSALPPISLDSVVIRNATLRYIDHATGTDITLDGIDIDLTMPDIGGPANIRLSASRGGQRGEITARIASVAGLLGGEVVGVDTTVSTDGARVAFTGRAGLQPLAAEGQIDLSGTRLAPVLALAGLGQMAEPLPGAARPISLTGQVTLAPAGGVYLRNGVLGVGSNRIGAALDVTFDGDRPNLRGTITADSLDFSAFTAGSGGASAPATGQTGWSRAPIDASALGLVNAQIGITLGPVKTGFGDLDRVAGTLTIERARAVLALQDVRAFDGTLTGELVANNRSGLSVASTLALRGVNLLPMLRQVAGFDRLSGSAAADLHVLGSGGSLDAIMRSLRGDGRIDFGTGEILGFDLAGMMSHLDASYIGQGNSTIYDSITGTFVIQDGVLSNTDLRLAASLLNVTGSGTVDLGAQTLDYRVIPAAARQADNGPNLSVPLLITGPWSAPRFRLDLQGIADQRLAEERARLEAAAREQVARIEADARARLQGAVQQQLGLPATPTPPATPSTPPSATPAPGGGAAPATPAPPTQAPAPAPTPQDLLRQQAEQGLRRLLGGGN